MRFSSIAVFALVAVSGIDAAAIDTNHNKKVETTPAAHGKKVQATPVAHGKKVETTPIAHGKKVQPTPTGHGKNVKGTPAGKGKTVEPSTPATPGENGEATPTTPGKGGVESTDTPTTNTTGGGGTGGGKGVVGKPDGFAAGTTGGGSAAPATPADIKELRAWLGDKTARVIVLDKEYNFLKTEGSKTVTGCRPDSNKCPGKGGQDALPNGEWCKGFPSVQVTYDVAAQNKIKVGSNKSLVGVGAKGIIRGTGLVIEGASNVIIQNVHITELNPHLIFGGDAIDLSGAKNVWIDHVKVSNVGREMFVTHHAANTGITISNTDFDGNTKYSASCNGHHYWGPYFNGVNNQITFARNWVHMTSGRSPKVITTLLHAVNNLFEDNTGHAFDISGGGAVVLAENNVFTNVKSPLNTGAGSGKLTATGNVLTGSGTFASVGSVSASQFSGSKVEKLAGGAVAASVKKNAGIGKI